MAKAKKITIESAEPIESPKTGTQKVFDADKVRIPGPFLPSPLEGLKPHEKVKEKVKEEKPAPFVVVPSQHIIKTLSVDLDRNRATRLLDLSRQNQDVAWLLSEFEKLKTQKEKSK